MAFVVLLCAAYANHFHNSFHFDDFHTVQNNLYLRNLANLPRFFTDSSTFSNLPTHQVYRPLLTASLALDYVRGNGQTLPFHVTTFVVYLLYLGCCYWLLRRIVNDSYWAFAGTAVYGLHPVCAETVNYIVQRAEIFSTFGVVAGLAIYLSYPALRKWGLYLVPVALAILCKPPALVFPLVLFAAVYLLETNRDWRAAARAIVPSVLVCAAFGLLLSRMTAATFNAGGASPALYRLTQSRIVLDYFLAYFAPLHLSADSDWQVLPDGLADPQVQLGLAFVTALGAAIYFTARRIETRPIAFGLIWFVIALFPTSWMPLGESANDHRMFFPFLGLTLSVAQSLRLLLRNRPSWQVPVTVGLCLIAVAEARGTSLRNEVWRDESSLWRDVAEKSPRNGRGLMNYGLTLMAKGQSKEALSYFERAHTSLPNYFILEINLAIAKSELGRHAEAEPHFLRAMSLEPARYEPQFFYGRWLNGRARTAEAIPRLEAAVRFNNNALDARHLLMQLYAAAGRRPEGELLANDTLRMAPGDETSTAYLRRQDAAPTPADTPESLLSRSLTLYNLGRFEECIQAARAALRLRPGYAEAHNNISAAYNAMKQWDDGIRAADDALRINPSYELARNNRKWAISQKEAR
ncbi:MAG TPA: hypothetical protein VFQ91_24010 [Bryobacteraceae bacterium]|nr:hypothetical protein [Bryobacteraceae bacterium]